MITQVRRLQSTSNLTPRTVFAVGLILLIGTWAIWYWWMSLFTEALLVPWYCCSQDTLPALGTWQRVINDFFDTLPGSLLPSLTFIFINASIFGVKVLRAKNKTWLPLTFVFANILLLMADLFVTSLSWSLSDWLVGPRVGGIDAGYHRTWYGIVSHLILWSIFFMTLAKVRVTKQ